MTSKAATPTPAPMPAFAAVLSSPVPAGVAAMLCGPGAVVVDDGIFVEDVVAVLDDFVFVAEDDDDEAIAVISGGCQSVVAEGAGG